MIEINDVSYSYLGIRALSHISIKIEAGEAVAIMGPNGSGKSTLLKLINGLIFADTGCYRFQGQEITENQLQDPIFAKKFHQKIGFVFQNSDTQLFCADVYDEIAFGPRQMGLSESEIGKRLNDLLELMQLDAFHHRSPYHLSGGEKRKVAIACVLSMNPEVLVLDEPINELDPRTQRWLVDFLIRLNKSGKTLITSTHNLELVPEISTRSILFDENHGILADMQTQKMLLNTDLLIKANLVDEYYHIHDGEDHVHFHDHIF